MANVEQIRELKPEPVDCQCSSCVSACRHKPGWMLPGEAEKIAAFLGISLAELFKTKLMVDWHEDLPPSYKDVFLLSPAVVDEEPGQEFGGDPRGTCVFLKDGLCSIHAVKPKECRDHMHGASRDSVQELHDSVAAAWKPSINQMQIRILLGRKPVSTEYQASLFGSLF